MFVELDPWIMQVLLRLKPDYETCVDKRGKMVARLDKAFYGCVQSARLWYEKLKAVLEGLDFTVNRYDPCVFNKIHTTESS